MASKQQYLVWPPFAHLELFLGDCLEVFFSNQKKCNGGQRLLRTTVDLCIVLFKYQDQYFRTHISEPSLSPQGGNSNATTCKIQTGNCLGYQSNAHTSMCTLHNVSELAYYKAGGKELVRAVMLYPSAKGQLNCFNIKIWSANSV